MILSRDVRYTVQHRLGNSCFQYVNVMPRVVDSPCGGSSPIACRIGLTFLGMILLSGMGCGGSGYSLVPVSGIVTIKGKPLANAQVQFSPPKDQPGPLSVGKTDAQGHFELTTLDDHRTGAVPGKHQVRITTAQSTGDDERAIFSKELVPPKYRNGSYSFEVPQEGTEKADIDIVVKGKRKRR